MSCVLIVDEYEPFREAMEFCLPRFGHEAVAARDVGEALRIAADHAIDVVLLDGGARWLSGLAVCERLKRDRRFERVPVVVMVAVVSPEMRDRARAVGAAEVIPKPFAWPDLLAALGRHAPAVGNAAPAQVPDQRAAGGEGRDWPNSAERTN